jgi:hypothetical protein
MRGRFLLSQRSSSESPEAREAELNRDHTWRSSQPRPLPGLARRARRATERSETMAEARAAVEAGLDGERRGRGPGNHHQIQGRRLRHGPPPPVKPPSPLHHTTIRRSAAAHHGVKRPKLSPTYPSLGLLLGYDLVVPSGGSAGQGTGVGRNLAGGGGGGGRRRLETGRSRWSGFF